MKKIVLIICSVIMPSLLLASGNFSFWWGYSFSSMASVNQMINTEYKGYDTGNYLDPIDAGTVVGLDGAYWYYSWWGIGGRVSLTMLFGGGASGIKSGNNDSVFIDGQQIQVLMGVPFLFEFLEGKISAGGGLYAGWGYAHLGISHNGSADAGGHCFVFEVPLRITYHISSSFLLDLNFSWKTANAADIYVIRVSQYYPGYTMGEKLPYGADFSGIMAGLGFNWRFSSKDWPWYNKKFSFSE
jgi:hypothetical protein